MHDNILYTIYCHYISCVHTVCVTIYMYTVFICLSGLIMCERGRERERQIESLGFKYPSEQLHVSIGRSLATIATETTILVH